MCGPFTSLSIQAEIFSFVPTFMNKVTPSTSKLDRLKYVIAMTVAGIYRGLIIGKPSDNLVGSTVEYTFADGTRYYAEQIDYIEG